MASLADRVKNVVNGGRARDAYKPIQMEEAAESRISLSARHVSGRYSDNAEPNADLDAEANVGLLTRDSNVVMEDEEEKAGWKKPERSLCTCCGINWKNPFKVLGIIALLAFIFGAYKLLAWAFYEPPAPPPGLEHLPVFGTSLGCHSASYLYNDTHTLTVNAAMHPERFDHGVDFHGGAVGTVTVASTTANSSNVRYEITLRSNDKDLVQSSLIKMPALDENGRLLESMATITTPRIPENKPTTCLRYDVKIFIPPSLKNFHLASHTRTHVKFDENVDINLEGLFVTLFTNDQENIIQSSTSVKAKKISMQITRGWLVGDVAIVDETTLSTQRGDAVLHVHVHPEPPMDKSNPELAAFDTTTGAGKTNVVIHSNEGMKRPIDATHISSKNGPVEVTYKNSGFNGLLAIEAGNLEETGMEKLDTSDVQNGEQWNYYVGSKDGMDRIRVNSRGRVGLYF